MGNGSDVNVSLPWSTMSWSLVRASIDEEGEVKVRRELSPHLVSYHPREGTYVGANSCYRTSAGRTHRSAFIFLVSSRSPLPHAISPLLQILPASAKNPHEPRAAMFLNRFTRSLAIMYATNALSTVLGVSPDEVKGKSFYECIQENCLAEAIRCLESAKANDSIAYMRFWFRDPRIDQPIDEPMTDGYSSEDEEEEEGGVYLDGHMDGDYIQSDRSGHRNSQTSSGNSTDMDQDSADAIFDDPATAASSNSSIPTTSGNSGKGASPAQQPDSVRRRETQERRIEVEAVVSCTSDGLVVVLRQARVIDSPPNFAVPSPIYDNGFFASPWAATPIMPSSQYADPHPSYCGAQVPGFGAGRPIYPTVNTAADSRGPPVEEFMNSIREVAVFAWSLTGINGSLARFGRGSPTGESQPPGGLPVWDPTFKRGPLDTGLAEFNYGSPLEPSVRNGHTQSRSEPLSRMNGFDQDHRNGDNGGGGGFNRQHDGVDDTVTPTSGSTAHDSPEEVYWRRDGERSHRGLAFDHGGGGVQMDRPVQHDSMDGGWSHGESDYLAGFGRTSNRQIAAAAPTFDNSHYAPWLSSNLASGFEANPAYADASQGGSPVGPSRWI